MLNTSKILLIRSNSARKYWIEIKLGIYGRSHQCFDLHNILPGGWRSSRSSWIWWSTCGWCSIRWFWSAKRWWDTFVLTEWLWNIDATWTRNINFHCSKIVQICLINNLKMSADFTKPSSLVSVLVSSADLGFPSRERQITLEENLH